MLTSPELTGELLTAVSAMAAGAPSSMLPTALLRLWTRAMELEMEVGVHNGARDAALQAAIDLLAAPAPSMCAPAAGASPFEIAIGMKEWHSWSSLKVCFSLKTKVVLLYDASVVFAASEAKRTLCYAWLPCCEGKCMNIKSPVEHGEVLNCKSGAGHGGVVAWRACKPLHRRACMVPTSISGAQGAFTGGAGTVWGA